ncbi:MAG: N-6 DNA methylase [Nitrososphaerota archaeon]|jgi:type I restriction-modification system DNA methylase subunit|nr:N-6 DNA methylase [Nitrososphaerota archaeon]
MPGSGEFASERDFVARYLLPTLEAASHTIGTIGELDFSVEPHAEGGSPDLTVTRGGKGVLVIEAKFKKKVGSVERDIEPRDPHVVEQAIRYAVRDGFPFYATCNARRLVLFQLRPGVKAYESELLTVEYSTAKAWAKEILLLALGRKKGSLKPADAVLIDTFHEAFIDLAPELLISLKLRLREKDFSKRFQEWLESQGMATEESTYRLVAEQTTYLQMNKILFYKILRVIYPDRLKDLRISDEEDVSERLVRFYESVRKIDYYPIYQQDILADVPLTEKAEIRVRTLLDTVNEYDFENVESDFIGRLYENLIDPLERKRLGQFYTPPAIAEMITNLTIVEPTAVVMDPSCGSGGFLVKAYHRLMELEGRAKPDAHLHRRLLTQIYGVDINQFPAHLSVVNLAVQLPKAHIDQVNVVVKDFFETRPGSSTLAGFESVATDGQAAVVRLPPKVDAVVGNPPYIRQEFLGDREKEKIEKCLAADYNGKVAVGTSATPSRVETTLNKQSDVFVFFFIHGLAYLKRGGRLGFITSNKWLEVGYGEKLQEFLLANTRIQCVVEFDRAVFPDLEVDTAITVLVKEPDENARLRNVVRFIRVKKPIAPDKLLALIREPDEDEDSDTLHLKSVTQGELKIGKWNAYLIAPSIFWKVIDSPMMRPLSEVADNIVRGAVTGSDDFFILTRTKARDLGIERRFLTPYAPAAETVAGLTLRPEHIKHYCITVREDLDKIAGTGAEKYLRYGEKLVAEPAKRRLKRMKLTEVPTIKARSPWYSLPDLPMPTIFFPMWYRYQFRAFLNQADAFGTNYWFYIIKKGRAKALTAFLNSSVAQLCIEVLGRQYSGMNHMMGYELKKLPSLDVDSLNEASLRSIEDAFDKLQHSMEVSSSGDNEEPSIEEVEEAREGLDRAIFSALSLSQTDRRAILRELEGLRAARTRRSR